MSIFNVISLGGGLALFLFGMNILASGMEKMGPVTQKLYDTLTGIQMGRIEAPEGWIKEIL